MLAFDGWGGAWGPASLDADDNAVPDVVVDMLDRPIEQVPVVCLKNRAHR